MKVFRTFEEANEPSGRGWCVALAESRIPGAGDHVGAAMRVLESGSQGRDAEAKVAYATEYWLLGRARGHEHKVADGQGQASTIEPLLQLVPNTDRIRLCEHDMAARLTLRIHPSAVV